MLELRLLHCFVTIADTGSFTAAAQSLNSTQSTVSQQIGRLESMTGKVLLDRTVRPVQLTPAGEKLIGYARRIIGLQAEAEAMLADTTGSRIIRVGLPDDLVTAAMSRTFARFTAQHPDTRLDVTTGLSSNLSRRYREGELDVVIVKEAEAHADAYASFCEPLIWVEAADNRQRWADPVPLIAFPPGGLYRDQMIERIEAVGLRWYLTFTGNSLASVLRAVEAGLGVSVLPLAATQGYNIKKCQQFEPVIPMTLSIYGWEGDANTRELQSAMRQVIALDRRCSV